MPGGGAEHVATSAGLLPSPWVKIEAVYDVSRHVRNPNSGAFAHVYEMVLLHKLCKVNTGGTYDVDYSLQKSQLLWVTHTSVESVCRHPQT
jgi:hypothetical protein